jgi:hypothetical protein
MYGRVYALFFVFRRLLTSLRRTKKESVKIYRFQRYFVLVYNRHLPDFRDRTPGDFCDAYAIYCTV